MNFEPIAEKFPADRDTVSKLAELFSRYGGQPAEFTLNRLCDLVEPKSRELLSVVLAEFVRRGWLRVVVRVESSNGFGIEDFDSIDMVPDVVHDWRTDQDVEVNPENLEVLYSTE